MASAHAETGDHTKAGAGPVPAPNAAANNIVSAYLSKHIPEYRELVELRREGWNNPSADMHFQNERSVANDPSEGEKDVFYQMTCRIGNELNSLLGPGIIALPPFPPRRSISVLDLGMAPGGFSTAVMTHNPNHIVSIHGVTLPISMGGYEVRIPNWRSDPRTAAANIKFLDVTMLASEMGIPSGAIPASHPDKQSFITTSLFPDHQKFDLIFCGSTVVRNHTKSVPYQPYRKNTEGTRLISSQLCIAMNRIRPGGTMVILLRRADAWPTVARIHTFSKFSNSSKMRLFKPTRAHARKGTFYLVVVGVDPERREAKEAVDAWRRDWMSASGMLDTTSISGKPGTDDGGDGEVSSGSETEEADVVQAVLEEFGPRLIDLTRPVFTIQANALRTAPWGSAARAA